MHEELSDLHKVMLTNFSKILQNNRIFLIALKVNSYSHKFLKLILEIKLNYIIQKNISFCKKNFY
jgi:hypothetical protein